MLVWFTSGVMFVSLVLMIVSNRYCFRCRFGNHIVKMYSSEVFVNFPADPYYLQLLGSVPEPFSHHASTVQDAYQDYQQLALGRAGLRQIYTLTLKIGRAHV